MEEDLTSEQLEELAALLRSLHVSLKESLQRGQEDSRPVDLDLPIGRLSRMDAMQQQKMAQANKRQTQIRLQQVESALRLLEQGEYGYCRQCDGVIAYGRLKARPESPFCIECQTALEKRR